MEINKRKRFRNLGNGGAHYEERCCCGCNFHAPTPARRQIRTLIIYCSIFYASMSRHFLKLKKHKIPSQNCFFFLSK